MIDTSAAAFKKIYDTHEWKGTSLSGPGSDPERTIEFRKFLQEFIRSKNIGRVVDFGCGDWTYASLVDWQSAHYIGIDVVKSVINRNTELYGSEKISFVVRNNPDGPLPEGDLFIAKEVLQHLPTREVQSILTLASNYRYCIFVNDIAHERRSSWSRAWRWEAVCDTNTDIDAGGYRLLSLRDSPFNIKARQALVYQNKYQNLRWTKEVLVVEQSSI